MSGIPQDLIRRSFAAAESLKTQSVCYDWVQRADEFCFVEISYGFMDEAVYACQGHWDRDMNWHEGHMYPSIAIIEDFIGACSGGPAA